MQIVEQYLKWADNYQEDQILLVYDTMWNATRIMAESIAKGISLEAPKCTVKLMNSAKYDKNDIVTEVFSSKTVLIGSSTINNGYLHSIAGTLEMIKGLKFKNKKAAAFGSYGWSGEAVKLISKELEESSFKIINEGIRVQWKPTEENIQECIAFGREIAKA